MTTKRRPTDRNAPRMYQVADLARRTPGRHMLYYAERVGPHGSRRYGYDIVHRAEAAGLVRIEYARGRGRVYPADAIDAAAAARA